MTTPTLPKQSLDQMLQHALALQIAGRLEDAAQRYADILRIAPDHPHANHTMGVLALQLEQPEAGLAYFQAALDAEPTRGQYWVSYIEALAVSGRLNEARELLALARQQGLHGDDVDALATRLEPDSQQAAQIESDDGYNGTTPDSQAIDALLALFAKGDYVEADRLAQTMTARFPLHAFGWKALGAIRMQSGKSSDALDPMQRAADLSPDDVEAHYNLGVSLQQLGRLNDAATSYRRALQINPDYADAHSNLGVTERNLGELDQARISLQRALDINPHDAATLSNLGAVLHDLGLPYEAETSFQRALELNPGSAATHNNLGNALKALGRMAEAEASYRQALTIAPDDADAHYNLGDTLRDLGRYEDAETHYRLAFQIDPSLIGALNNLALLFIAQGRWPVALDTVKQALRISQAGEARGIFVACVKCLHFIHDDAEIRAAMIRALTEPWGRPNELARCSIDLIKLDPEIGNVVTRASDAWPARLSAQDLFGAGGLDALVADRLLRAVLDAAPVCDLAMERFLSLTRHALLEAVSTTTALTAVMDSSVLDFYGALARQCFINEYVFAATATELRQAGDLRAALIAALEADAPIPTVWPITVAAYFPLYLLPCADRLLERDWPESVAAVLTQQVREPQAELQLRASIPRLTDIDDEVSLRVQDQYEANPYPRWIKLAPGGTPKDITEYLRQQFPLTPVQHSAGNERIDILIAGCGTGQHSITTARKIAGAEVLAIDLSMSSLAYAKRKTRELGIDNIEYAQADLLKLATSGRRFDLIESNGVLHHLGDPWAGWRVLLSLLRPGGFMNLGFYSELARQDVVRIRRYIAEHGYASSASDIRLCRQALMEPSVREKFVSTLSSPDFFSTSACRDLLFHVQEHRLSLPEIDRFLRAHKLTFLGFEIERGSVHAYQRRFPADLAATNLQQWDSYEHAHPDTFAGMYQFWVQKTE
jgi:tetratricopeptide (TPR) repeat protein/2-polyprenyl-3-methyl-5-hydroxy-6-metoxy-1,4-benzoquinol methylase